MATPVVTQFSVWNSGGSSVASLTYAHTVPTSSNLILVAVGWNNANSVISATYNGVALTEVISEVGTNSTYCAIFSLFDPALGSNDVVITSAVANARITVFSASVENASSIVNSTSTIMADSAFTYNITTSPEQLVFDSIHWRESARWFTYNDGSTNITDDTVNSQGSRGVAGHRSAGAGSETTISGTFSGSTDRAAVAVAISGETGQLATPTNFIFTKATGLRQISGSWSSVAEATSYDYEVQSWNGSTWINFAFVNTVLTSFTLNDEDGVQFSTSYRARVRAVP